MESGERKRRAKGKCNSSLNKRVSTVQIQTADPFSMLTDH